MNDTAKTWLDKTISMIDGAYAPSTIRAYKTNFENFIKYCEKHELIALPANSDAVAGYIRIISDGRLKSSSVRIAVAAISAIHRLNRITDPCEDPTVKIEVRRTNRKLGRYTHQAFGITNDLLNKMINTLNNDLRSARDRAILLLAYDGMCRRSEIVSIKFEDLQTTYKNNRITDIRVKLRKSKTDQEGIGHPLYTSETCKKAIIDWLEKSQITEGFLFRAIKKDGDLEDSLSASKINKLFKDLAKKACLPEETIKNISGHSARIGAAQDLLKSGASLAIMMQRGRWSKPDTLMRYVEYAE